MTVTPFLLIIIAEQLMLFLSKYDLRTFNYPEFTTRLKVSTSTVSGTYTVGHEFDLIPDISALDWM